MVGIGAINVSNIEQSRIEVKDEIEGLWTVDELINELYSLSGKFIDYKRGLV